MKQSRTSPFESESLLANTLWYSAAATTVLGMAAAPASAQIVFTDVDPDVTLHADPGGPDATLGVDFDDDGDPELILQEQAETTGGAASDYIAGFTETDLGTDQIIAIVSASSAGYQYFLPLSNGQSIGAGNVATIGTFVYGPTFTFQGGDPNNWLSAGDAYAGVQFQLDGGDMHFGWVNLEITSVGTVVVKGYAYESTPDTPINAGDMPVAIGPGPDGMPGTHNLSAIYPNPFNPQAQFSLEIAEQQNVSIVLYDALGRQVEMLHDGTLNAGSIHEFQIDGASLPSGVYVVRALGERFTDVRQVTLTK